VRPRTTDLGAPVSPFAASADVRVLASRIHRANGRKEITHTVPSERHSCGLLCCRPFEAKMGDSSLGRKCRSSVAGLKGVARRFSSIGAIVTLACVGRPERNKANHEQSWLGHLQRSSYMGV